MNKQKALDALRQKALEDKSLPFADTATNIVFGKGSTDPKVYFLGEAPGKNEDLQGLPFVGQAGNVLSQLLESIGLKREDVFITSALWFRPPKNRDPKPKEIAAFQKYLDEQIKILDPKVIVTLGRYSLNKFLPGKKISEVHGKAQKVNIEGKEITVIPMYHPASVLYRRDLMKTLEEDFKEIAKSI